MRAGHAEEVSRLCCGHVLRYALHLQRPLARLAEPYDAVAAVGRGGHDTLLLGCASQPTGHWRRDFPVHGFELTSAFNYTSISSMSVKAHYQPLEAG